MHRLKKSLKTGINVQFSLEREATSGRDMLFTIFLNNLQKGVNFGVTAC